MADNIPRQDVEQVWNESEHSWEGLARHLESRRDRAEGIEDSIVDRMLEVAKSKKGQPFPGSPDELYEVLNREAAHSGSRGR